MNPNEGGNGVEWLNSFLAKTFFQDCNGDNHTNPENPENRYCIDCDQAACQRCMAQPTHDNHRVLNIYRLCYKDVVPLPQINSHIDCKYIQPYASNGRQVLSLHPLPHNNSGQVNPERACRTCARKLMHPDNCRYCSIECKPNIQPAAQDDDPKDDVGSASGSGSGSGAGGRRQGRDGGGGGGGGKGKSGTLSYRPMSRRKGVPHRAPMY